MSFFPWAWTWYFDYKDTSENVSDFNVNSDSHIFFSITRMTSPENFVPGFYHDSLFELQETTLSKKNFTYFYC